MLVICRILESSKAESEKMSYAINIMAVTDNPHVLGLRTRT